MKALSAVMRLNWTLIRHNAICAGAAVLTKAARHRASATDTAIQQRVVADGRVQVRIDDAALSRRESGTTDTPPASCLTPSQADRAEVRAAMMDSLRKEMSCTTS